VTRDRARAIAVLLTLVALTAVVTWPQPLHLATRVGEHDDPLFSIWRLTWIAHALATDPRHLFDANIFFPATNTLSFSDAMLLEGALASPLIWLGVSPVLAYNLLLLGGIVLCGLAMFLLARHLTGETGPALVAAAVFTVAPYRIGHFIHLELQWAMWMPLAFLAIHHVFEKPTWRAGLLAGVFLWLQILSSVYYGVFLAMVCVVLTAAMALVHRDNTPRALVRLAAGGAVAAVLTLPYAWPYLHASQTMLRAPAEINTYSANLWNYFASAPQSALWGWTSEKFGGPEFSLFPGAAAILLALAAVFNRHRKIVVVYAALTFVALELSLGLNGHLYAWLSEQVQALRGLRSPSRFGIVVSMTMAAMAGFGAQTLKDLATRTASRVVQFVTPALIILVAVESSTSGMTLAPVPLETGDDRSVYIAIRRIGPGPVVEMPLPKLYALPGHEPMYMLWSIAHWNPLVNGYSGYYPPEYSQTVVRTEHFPDDQSIAQLTNLGIRYVVVHRAYYDDDSYRALIGRITERKELIPLGTFVDPFKECSLFLVAK
jgi:hypothetical protein